MNFSFQLKVNKLLLLFFIAGLTNCTSNDQDVNVSPRQSNSKKSGASDSEQDIEANDSSPKKKTSTKPAGKGSSDDSDNNADEDDDPRKEDLELLDDMVVGKSSGNDSWELTLPKLLKLD